MGVDKARTAESGCDQRSSGLAQALQEFSAKGPTRIWRLGGLGFTFLGIERWLGFFVLQVL